MLVHGLNYAPEPVGVGKYTAGMAEGLVLRGFDVRVVTARPYYPWWRAAPKSAGWAWREERSGVRVRRCPLHVPAEPGGLGRMAHLASFAACSLPALACNLAWRPQVVLAVAPTLACAPAALALARVCGAAAWLHVQDLELDLSRAMELLPGGPFGKAGLALAHRLEGLLLTRFDRVSAVSRSMGLALERKGVRPERISLLPNWADLEVFKPIERMEGQGVLRAMLGVEPGRGIVLYAGSLGRKQDLDLAALAARLLAQEERANAPLFVFCGQGPELERLARDHDGVPNLRFLPLQPETIHAAMLAEADAHLLPQRPGADGRCMPSKLVSILACGGPLVATAAPGSELARVVAAAGGLVVPHADAEALAHAVSGLLTDNAMRQAARIEARAYAELHMDGKTILDGLGRSLLELIQCSGDPAGDGHALGWTRD